MEVNCHKSCFLAQNIDAHLEQRLKEAFNIQILNLEQGMKYLGFFINPNDYRLSDWMWMIQKV